MTDNFQEESQFYGKRVFLSWIKTDKIEKYRPITQVYGVVFNEEGKILVARETKDFEWIIPGGRPRDGEELEQTLTRELREEVDVEADSLKPVGVQKVYFPNNPNKGDGEIFYQARFVGKLKKLLKQTPDPDSGNTWERKFVFVDEIGNYIKWGKTGETMFKDAFEVYKNMI